ncbi:MAG TPA: hypothetical protein VKD19_09475 [Pseudolabrys sp.]|jgi:hypothetical protein|nr:hypothetical protein [Pseudolabrys sp.]
MLQEKQFANREADQFVERPRLTIDRHNFSIENPVVATLARLG